jgi:nucleotide-binding universal stress UspA family protein
MKILLAIDGSPCSDEAIEELTQWPWLPQCELRIITVDTPVDPGLLRGGPASVFDEIVQRQRAESAKRLCEVAATLGQKSPGLRVSTALLEGWPKDAIVTEAERYGANVVIVGSHGYGPIRRLFLGSVSLFVAHNAPCSVLIVRPSPDRSLAGNAPAAT